jgi:hypothetical protein
MVRSAVFHGRLARPQQEDSAMPVETSVPRSRRSLLAAAAVGLTALVAGALGRPVTTRAAAGDNLKIGQVNDAGTSQTILLDDGLGAAFTLKTTNVSTGATGIVGWSSQTGGNATRGVYGKVDSPNSHGIQARNTALSHGTGAALQAIGGNNHGVDASTANGSSYAVRGRTSSTADDAVAIYGEVSGPTSGLMASGVRGVHKGTAQGLCIGVWGSGPTHSNGVGVLGEGEGGYGVQGFSDSGIGVAGISESGHGVWGFGHGPGYAGLFDGNLRVEGDAHVTGTLSKGAGAFKIDHPLDPATKYLSHSFVESPDMKNVYDGLVTLDARGEATVALPAYFETLNRDVRYQLTPLGAFSPLYVKAKVAKSRFRIAGGTAGQEVCWQVTGIRKDAFAEAHRIVVEEAKPAADRGLYLHPQLYGQPAEKGIEYRLRPAKLRQTAAG